MNLSTQIRDLQAEASSKASSSANASLILPILVIFTLLVGFVFAALAVYERIGAMR